MLKFIIQVRISQERIDLNTISGGMQQLILTLKMDREGINCSFSTRRNGDTWDTGSRHLPPCLCRLFFRYDASFRL
jgi:hypothetical protein